MELTAEVLLDVLRSLRTDAAAAQMRRRRLPRVGVRLRLTILPCGPAEPGRLAERPTPAIVRLRDLSRRGLGFVHTRPLAIGQPFLITLPRQAGGLVHLLGRVERCRPIDGGAFDVGGSIRLDVPREEIEYYLRESRRSA